MEHWGIVGGFSASGTEGHFLFKRTLGFSVVKRLKRLQWVGGTDEESIEWCYPDSHINQDPTFELRSNDHLTRGR